MKTKNINRFWISISIVSLYFWALGQTVFLAEQLPESVPVIFESDRALPDDKDPAAKSPVAEAKSADAGRTAVAAPAAAEPSEENGNDFLEFVSEDGIPEDEGDGLISISLKDVPLSEVIRIFAEASGANIITKADLEQPVSMSLNDVEWRPAIEAILDQQGMNLIEKPGGIYAVISRAEANAEPVQSLPVFLKYNTVENIEPTIKSMLVHTNASVAVFPSGNALVVKETPSRLKSIAELIDRLDQPRKQVFIEAKFVELNDQAIEDLGINWQVLSGYTLSATSLGIDRTVTRSMIDNNANYDTGERVISKSRTRARTDGRDLSDTGNYNSTVVEEASNGEGVLGRDATKGRVTIDERSILENRIANDGNASGFTDGFIKGNNVTEISDDGIKFEPVKTVNEIMTAILSADDFALTLSALEQSDGVEIVSDPKVIVHSGHTANIHVGRNEPNVVAVPQGESGRSFAYQLDKEQPYIEIGVKLEVTPTVNTESNITVRIAPELSRKLGDLVVGEAGTSFPITQIRKIETEFNIANGLTVAIGGLTVTEDVENIRKIPLLGDIPLIGKYLFTHRHMEQRQDEVIVFVTVTVANSEAIHSNQGLPEESKLIHRHLAKNKFKKEEQKFNWEQEEKRLIENHKERMRKLKEDAEAKDAEGEVVEEEPSFIPYPFRARSSRKSKTSSDRTTTAKLDLIADKGNGEEPSEASDGETVNLKPLPPAEGLVKPADGAEAPAGVQVTPEAIATPEAEDVPAVKKASPTIKVSPKADKDKAKKSLKASLVSAAEETPAKAEMPEEKLKQRNTLRDKILKSVARPDDAAE